jgi:phosphomannomutase
VTRVSHSIIKAISIKKGAVFSGESSGHFFIKTKHGFFETPLLVALYIMREISIEGKKISEIIAPFKKYSHSGEINFLVDNKGRVMSEFEKKFRIGAKNVDHLDGITIEHDQYWMNVRPSNTESLLRLNLEAINKKVMEAKRDEISDFIISLGGSLASH